MRWLSMLVILLSFPICAQTLDITAHRGDSKHFYENSFPAIESAFLKGASSVEFDIVLTADGQAVVHHNFELDPEKLLPSVELSEKDIRRLKLAQISGFNYKDCVGQCQILTLSELLAFARKVKAKGTGFIFHLEVKRNKKDRFSPGDFARIIGKEIAAADCMDVFTIRSFDFSVIKAFKKSFSKIPRILLVGKDFHRTHRELLLRSRKAIIKDYAPTTIAPHYSLVTRRFVKDWGSYGIGINPYTVNDFTQAQKLIKLGVIGITTDDPELLRAQDLLLR